MKCYVFIVILFKLNMSKGYRQSIIDQIPQRNLTCGVDNAPVAMVYEGEAEIGTYPWIGVLYYTISRKRFTTPVVLVTKQIVIGTADEIDKLPKDYFRARARVSLGEKCGEPGIRVRDYSYHPDYKTNSLSALALVQLETDHVKQELRPICPPPSMLVESRFHAMSLSNDCRKPKVTIYSMKYVNMERCKQFYNRSGLDERSLWPTHTACARAVSRRRCVWRSGTVLTVKQDGRWRLLGFGIYGPGCQAPSRFLDYGMYHAWVQRSVARVGRPAITRLAPNHLIMRRSLSNVQRYGDCDPEEKQTELYTDMVNIKTTQFENSRVKYNVSIYGDTEYSCIIFNANGSHSNGKGTPQPRIYLRRWCAGPPNPCFGFQHIEIHFYVEIVFFNSIVFRVLAYGKEAKIIDVKKVNLYANKHERYPKPPIPNYSQVLQKFNGTEVQNKFQGWFFVRANKQKG